MSLEISSKSSRKIVFSSEKFSEVFTLKPFPDMD